MRLLGLEKPFKRALYRKGRFSRSAPPKFFRLSIGNEVRKNGYIIKENQLHKDSDGTITEIQVTYDEDSRGSGSGSLSQRKVAGTLHWVSMHMQFGRFRLYDRLFIDEAPDSHKEKKLLDFMNQIHYKL
jgi:glutaminyl-tRNA synthetase